MSEREHDMSEADSAEGVAVVGMSGRFPGARDIAHFWQNLRDGVESIRHFRDEELERAGIDPARIADPSYVPAKGWLDDADLFDAAFFGYTPREGEVMDPQHRIFLQCAWSALESAGYEASGFDGPIGVFGGSSRNSYLLSQAAAGLSGLPGLDLTIGNGADFLSTRVSYKLDLKGPGMTVQTACSTSLVAVVLGCQSLLDYQCDMVLAGGVSVTVPRVSGYPFMQGSIGSPDGHCRAFDALAGGTVGGEGVAVVVLKRLADALRDGDTIHAVIKGAAINNDGALKVGYTAPSVEGQAEVISMALAQADIDPDTIDYVEAHGTGTRLGDPIEIAALTRAFRLSTERRGYCAIGSVKTNIGHLDAAAGVAGLIKAILAMEHGQLPPSLHFTSPNPELHLSETPFVVNAALRDWPRRDRPRRAGVSSFGIGGTNAHVVIEEAPPRKPAGPSRRCQLITLSARTPSALEQASRNLAEVLRSLPRAAFAEAAYTLKVGRKRFAHRMVLVADDPLDAAEAFAAQDPRRVIVGAHEAASRPVAFMFPGQGSQRAGMGVGLYQEEPVYREAFDACAAIVEAETGVALRALLYDEGAGPEDAAGRLNRTEVTQPALFAVEYAMARLWLSWGVRPDAMIGHSIGEYVAACLAGVFSLPDALRVVCARGRLMQAAPRGAMLVVGLPEASTAAYLGEDVQLAAVNEAGQCVLAGPVPAIGTLRAALQAQGVTCHRLATSHAFHSSLMDGVLAPFTQLLRTVELSPPEIPFQSNLTGAWITAAQATDPAYWARHLRGAVRFASGLDVLLEDPNRILIEVGPGAVLTGLAARSPRWGGSHVGVGTTGRSADAAAEQAAVLENLGRLWIAGLEVDWAGFYRHERRCRVPLPTYPFEGSHLWMTSGTAGAPQQAQLAKSSDLARWFYAPSWHRSVTPRDRDAAPLRWLLFADDSAFGQRLAAALRDLGGEVVQVRSGPEYGCIDAAGFVVGPGSREDCRRVLDVLDARGWRANRVVHAWGAEPLPRRDGRVQQGMPSERELQSVADLACALDSLGAEAPIDLIVLTHGAHEVLAHDPVSAARAAVVGLCRVVPQDLHGVTCRLVDVDAAQLQGGDPRQLVAELAAPAREPVVAYRGGYRWLQRFEPFRVDASGHEVLRAGGVYLITGGLGRIGLALAGVLAERVQARLVLVGRSGVPDRSRWAAIRESGADASALRRVAGIERIEAAGGEVMAIEVDVADPNAVRSAVEAAEQRFGAVNGVVHAAGMTTGESLAALPALTREAFAAQLEPKLAGALNLDAALAGRTLDFKVSMSSLASVLGGLRFGAYASANAALDALAGGYGDDPGCGWQVVAWDGWRFGDPPAGANTQLARLSMLPEEGIEVFRRVLSVPDVARILISSADLSRRLEQTNLLAAAPEAEAETSVEHARYERPQMVQAFAAPESELERRIAEVWQELLGIDRVGLNDDFFALGGHSLLALRIIFRLNSELGLDLPTNAIFVHPTIAEIAGYIEGLSSDIDEAEVAELLDLVEQLSDEELKVQLSTKEKDR
jgi:phthiocerol/phenolphthiocerol synthesis type-I polyketide synthase E